MWVPFVSRAFGMKRKGGYAWTESRYARTRTDRQTEWRAVLEAGRQVYITVTVTVVVVVVVVKPRQIDVRIRDMRDA